VGKGLHSFLLIKNHDIQLLVLFSLVSSYRIGIYKARYESRKSCINFKHVRVTKDTNE
jgi:hypothetical protein